MGVFGGGEPGGFAGVGEAVSCGRAVRLAPAVVASAVSAALVSAPSALARAGGGSSGFRGFGRGGGGFGRGFGGHGHFLFIPVGGGAGLFLFILVLLIVFFVLPRLVVWWRGQQTAGVASR